MSTLPDAVIARLEQDDWREFKAIRLEALRIEPGAFSSTFADWENRPASDWRHRLGIPESLTCVARVQDRTVGMAGAILGGEGGRDVAIIVGMYVTASHRGHGLGRRLLQTIIGEIARHPEIATIRLSVMPTQHAARRLYESLGFSVAANPDRSQQDGPAAHEEIAMERPVKEESA